MADVKKVVLGGRTYLLPFEGLIPFEEHQVRELRQAIKDTGEVVVPIVCWKEKRLERSDTVVEGATRVRLAAELGLKSIPTILRSFESEEDARAECDRLNLDRRHLTTLQLHGERLARKERVAVALANGKSQRQIAKEEGTSRVQIQRDIEEINAEKETPQVETGPPGPIEIFQGEEGNEVEEDVKANLENSVPAATEPEPKEEPRGRKPISTNAPPTIEDRIRENNSALEAWAKKLLELAEQLPVAPWLRDLNRGNTVLSKLKSAADTARSAKVYAACPICQGTGQHTSRDCLKCYGCGMVTKYAYDQMV